MSALKTSVRAEKQQKEKKRKKKKKKTYNKPSMQTRFLAKAFL
jgi:hypothetical protein